ncbi:MAG: diguanylate cyclase [Chitinivibrionales bacterium]|nr:diguanylate cyclase [Chitinivibrionales bacterium]
MYVDCGNVGEISEESGVLAGNNVLRIVGRELLSTARRQDMVVRMPGDEFVVCLPDTDFSQAGPLAEAVRDSLVRRLARAGFESGLSIGVCTFRTAPRRIKPLMQKLREATALARSSGGNAVHHLHVTETL